jgi:hypothetical protein
MRVPSVAALCWPEAAGLSVGALVIARIGRHAGSESPFVRERVLLSRGARAPKKGRCIAH